MIPFSSMTFFIAVLIAAGLQFAFGAKFSRYVPFRFFALLVALTFDFLLLPQPWHLALFLLTQYAICRAGFLPRPYRVLLSLAPMLAIKLQVPLEAFQVIGLSFMTFRAVQVAADPEAPRDLSLLDFVVFVGFPMTLLAGPVDRYRSFQTTLRGPYPTLMSAMTRTALSLSALGIFQKFAVASLIDEYWLANWPADVPSLKMMAANAYGYAAYLYFDFAGYSNMAIGLSALLGFVVPKNFDRPYLAANPPEFWRRWHVSLSEFLRDYVFMPLYKAARGFPSLDRFRFVTQNVCTFFTLFLMGIWNGLQPHYVVSGILFGSYSVGHAVYANAVKTGKWKPRLLNHPVVGLWLRRILMLHAAVVGLYVFGGRVPQIATFEANRAMAGTTGAKKVGGTMGQLNITTAPMGDLTDEVKVLDATWLNEGNMDAIVAQRTNHGWRRTSDIFSAAANQSQPLAVWDERGFVSLPSANRMSPDGFTWDKSVYPRNDADPALAKVPVTVNARDFGESYGRGLEIHLGSGEWNRLAVFLQVPGASDFRRIDVESYSYQLARGHIHLHADRPAADGTRSFAPGTARLKIFLGRDFLIPIRTNWGGFSRKLELEAEVPAGGAK